MYDNYQLSVEDKTKLVVALDDILSLVNCTAVIEDPSIIHCTSKNLNETAREWDSYVYEIKIIGELGDFALLWSFDHSLENNLRVRHVARYIVDRYWLEKDGDINSRLYNAIWSTELK
jgi:hypothetical protein